MTPREQALHDALRKTALTDWYYQDGKGNQRTGGRCRLCNTDWTNEESHAPGCLAATQEEPRQPDRARELLERLHVMGTSKQLRQEIDAYLATGTQASVAQTPVTETHAAVLRWLMEQPFAEPVEANLGMLFIAEVAYVYKGMFNANAVGYRKPGMARLLPLLYAAAGVDGLRESPAASQATDAISPKDWVAEIPYPQERANAVTKIALNALKGEPTPPAPYCADCRLVHAQCPFAPAGDAVALLRRVRNMLGAIDKAIDAYLDALPVQEK